MKTLSVSLIINKQSLLHLHPKLQKRVWPTVLFARWTGFRLGQRDAVFRDNTTVKP